MAKCVILQKFRQSLSSDFDNDFMGLSNEDIRKIISWVVDHGLSTAYAADKFDVTRRRIQQLVKEYKDTGKVPTLKTRGRKSYADYPDDIEERIIRAWNKLHTSANSIAKYLRTKDGIKIADMKVHQVLLENNMARENDNKKGRKKPWIRYERNHSLSAVHMDWHQNKHRQWVCAVLDDASRKILSCGEYDRRSGEASIELLDQAFEKYQHVKPIREVITDHGTEFYANKRDKDGEANHSFEKYCKDKGIKQLLCRYNHPQSNGKIEKWFHTYEQHRYRYDTLEEFIDWYNTIKPHMSLDWDNLQTPEQAFWKKCRSDILGSYFEGLENTEEYHETK